MSHLDLIPVNTSDGSLEFKIVNRKNNLSKPAFFILRNNSLWSVDYNVVLETLKAYKVSKIKLGSSWKPLKSLNISLKCTNKNLFIMCKCLQNVNKIQKNSSSLRSSHKIIEIDKSKGLKRYLQDKSPDNAHRNETNKRNIKSQKALSLEEKLEPKLRQNCKYEGQKVTLQDNSPESVHQNEAKSMRQLNQKKIDEGIYTEFILSPEIIKVYRSFFKNCFGVSLLQSFNPVVNITRCKKLDEQCKQAAKEKFALNLGLVQKNQVAEVKKNKIRRSPRSKVNILKPVTKSTTSSKNKYTSVEDEKILNFIIENCLEKQVKGNAIWKKIASKLSLPGKPRTWQSLKNRYLKNLLPHLESFNIVSPYRTRLRAGAHQGQLKKKPLKSLDAKRLLFKKTVKFIDENIPTPSYSQIVKRVRRYSNEESNSHQDMAKSEKYSGPSSRRRLFNL